MVDGFLWRPHKYNEKYATQELSLLYQIYRLGGSAGGSCDVVVDIGAGKANLSSNPTPKPNPNPNPNPDPNPNPKPQPQPQP